MLNYRRRDGYTLIELLVAIAILAVLIGLLLPAVQRVREAANLTYCKNNIKQIATAVYQFEIEHGYYPLAGNGPAPSYDGPGRPTPIYPDRLRCQDGSWLFQILPLLEYESIYFQHDAKDVTEAITRTLAAQIPTYFCPSRQRQRYFRYEPPATNGSYIKYGRVYPPHDIVHGLKDYIANGGTFPDELNGIFLGLAGEGDNLHNVFCTAAMVTDGLSNTMMVSEFAIPIDAYYHPSKYTISITNSYASGHTATRGYGKDLFDYYRKRVVLPHSDRTTIDKWKSDFGSAHTTGLNVGFLDGSVRFMRYQVSPEIWLSIFGRNDGLVMGSEE
ncbi:MAG: DUF1559 domain-containing protein [Gemmataceae bacterium]|nr:DUF1559 domain-containing protein [Gemmataceae bacterium]